MLASVFHLNNKRSIKLIKLVFIKMCSFKLYEKYLHKTKICYKLNAYQYTYISYKVTQKPITSRWTLQYTERKYLFDLLPFNFQLYEFCINDWTNQKDFLYLTQYLQFLLKTNEHETGKPIYHLKCKREDKLLNVWLVVLPNSYDQARR